MTSSHPTLTRLSDYRPASAPVSPRSVHIRHHEARPLFNFSRLGGLLVTNDIAGTTGVRHRVEATLLRLLPAPSDQIVASFDVSGTNDAAPQREAASPGRHLRLVG